MPKPKEDKNGKNGKVLSPEDVKAMAMVSALGDQADRRLKDAEWDVKSMRKLLSVGRGPFTDGRAEEVKGAELALITLKGVVTVLKERIGKARKLNSKSLLSDVQKKFEEVEGAFATVRGSKRRLEILVYGPIS